MREEEEGKRRGGIIIAYMLILTQMKHLTSSLFFVLAVFSYFIEKKAFLRFCVPILTAALGFLLSWNFA